MLQSKLMYMVYIDNTKIAQIQSVQVSPLKLLIKNNVRNDLFSS